MKNKTRLNFLACILAAFFLGQGKSFADPITLVTAAPTATAPSLVEKLNDLLRLDVAEQALSKYANNTAELTDALVKYVKENPDSVKTVAKKAVGDACAKKAEDDRKTIEETLSKKEKIERKLQKLAKLSLSTIEGKRNKEEMESQGMAVLSEKLARAIAKEKEAKN